MIQRVNMLDAVVADLIRDGHPAHPELLVKIDVQGFEGEVIRGGEAVLGRAKIVIVETTFVELYVGQPLFGTIHEQLSRLGFAFQGNLSQLWNPEDGRILQADSLYAR